jgi:nitrogen fixation-related uncharacterized protein
MSLGLTIATTAVAVVTGLLVIGLFIWGAVKDGQDQDARGIQIHRRSWLRRND